MSTYVLIHGSWHAAWCWYKIIPLLEQAGHKAIPLDLYADCSEEDVALATALLTPEPNVPVATPLNLSDEKFGRVARVYIETLQDKGVTPTLQKKMCTASSCQKVISMETSHSPFLSAPEKLVSHLASL